MKVTRLTQCSASSKLIGRLVLALLVVMLPGLALGTPKSVSFSTASAQVDAYDYAEISATVDVPDARDPFTDATLSGFFQKEDGSQHWNVEGFCDSMDGSIFRIRFMPSSAGIYKYQFGLCRPDLRKPPRERFGRLMDTGADLFVATSNIPGISFGRELESTIFSMAPPRTG